MAGPQSSVPEPTFGPLGFIIPAVSAILTGVLADYNAAFGGNLNPALNTPQGQLASSLTAIIDNCNQLFLKYTNLVDPALSSGRMQDAIAYIYFLIRNPAQPTVVTATCSGLPNVLIPSGSLAQDVNGNLYASTSNATISSGGTVSVDFAAVIPGPTSCA